MMSQEYPCRFCEKKNSEPLYPVKDIFDNDFHINKCRECNTYFLTPPPSEAILNQAYDSSYYGEKEEKFNPILEFGLDYFRKVRARRLVKYLNPGARVLDIGCGNGRFLSSLLKYGKFELYGTEMEGNSAKRAMRIKEINLKVGVLKKDMFTPESFDAITMFHVYEHLTHPKEYLEIINAILKPGGIFLISFPNIGSFQSEKFKGDWLHLDPPRHLFFQTPKDFLVIMKNLGYSVLQEKYNTAEQNPYGMVQSFLNKWNKKREILLEFFKGNKAYIKDVSKINIFFQISFFAFSFPIFLVTDYFSSFNKKGASVEFVFRKKV